MIPVKKQPTFHMQRVWTTLTIVSLSVLALLSDALSDALIYDRSLLLQGQLWRSWTGHVVHFGSSHLLWDLAVFLPAGCWLEYLWPRLARLFYVGCPLVISAMLIVFEPSLIRYAGLSGLATGVLVLLAGLQMRFRLNRQPTWLWVSVLALVGIKIGHELITGEVLVVADLGGSIRSVPLAHVGGAVCGIFFWLSTCLLNGKSEIRQ